jgi:hypothetical protein
VRVLVRAHWRTLVSNRADKISTSGLCLLALGFALSLAACEEDVGQIAVKVASGFSPPSLAIGPDKLFASETERFKAKEDGSPTILRQPPGPVRLFYERGGGLVTACSFNVRKNRVVTVTLRVVSREVRCEILE